MCVHLCDWTKLLDYCVQDFGSKFRVSHFASAKLQCDLDLVTFTQKLLHVSNIGIKVSLADLWLELDFLHRDLHGLLARLFEFLRLFVAEFAVVHNATYGWICLRSDFDEIEFCNTRSFKCVGNAHNSNL